MKQLIVIACVCMLALGCKEKEAQKEENTFTAVKENKPTPRVYPSGIASVFKAHGGIDHWNTMGSLKYTLEKESGNETHTVNLDSRKTLIKTDKYKLGFDGEKVWLEQDSIHFPAERARFYHNLYFYFYAMPFVLGDEGISYTNVDPLIFDGKSYPGIKISFGTGIGDAPDDNYILYSDPETNEMAWLAYTVTYGGRGKSENYSYIKYDQWQDVNGIKLPKALQWYTVEEGKPVAQRNEQLFINPTVSNTAPDNTLFEKPENGTFAE